MLAMPAKRRRSSTTPSGSDAEGDVAGGEFRQAKGRGASSIYKGVRKEKRGKWSAKILVREQGKATRTQMRLGAYNKELEAATAYAAAAYVVRDGKRVAGTVELTDVEKGLLQGCNLAAIKRIVKGRMWFRWTEWENALADCPEDENPDQGDTHSDSLEEAEEEDEEMEADAGPVDQAEAGRGTPQDMLIGGEGITDPAASGAGVNTGVALAGAHAAQGASNVTPNATVASSVGTGDEDVGSEGAGTAAPVRLKAMASVLGEAPSTAGNTAPEVPPPPGPDNPFVAMPGEAGEPASASRRYDSFADDNVVISRSEFEALKKANEESDRKLAHLEAQLLAAHAPKRDKKRQRERRAESGSGGKRASKRRRVESGSEDDTTDEEEGGRGGSSAAPAQGAPLDKVTDTIVNWDRRRSRLSNSAGGNEQVVDGLHHLACAAVKEAIGIFKPKYDGDLEAWEWGEHGLMLSSCGLEHLIPATYAKKAAAQQEAAGSESMGSG
ncbi:unnamed protein product [Closterium sp. Naga37s-1]|nr:unnamed protein product [Closterium sp. Naga37s-1]